MRMLCSLQNILIWQVWLNPMVIIKLSNANNKTPLRQVAFCWQCFIYGSDACCSKCSTAEHWFLPTLYLVEHQVKVEGAKLQALLSHKTQWPYFHWQIALLGTENVLIDKLTILLTPEVPNEWMHLTIGGHRSGALGSSVLTIHHADSAQKYFYWYSQQ